MPHGNALLSEQGRLKMARFHVQSGSSIRGTAERFQVSTTTVQRWAGRYREVLASGREPVVGDMADRSSRPRRCPRQTPAPKVRKIKHLRTKRRLGPVQIAGRVGMPASTVHRVLVRCGLNRLAALDRATGEPIRRYERAVVGELVHVDVKKYGLIPPGGGWKVHGRSAMSARRLRGRRNRAGWARRSVVGRVGYAYVHSIVDDHSRLAYSEIHHDETAATAVAFWNRAVAFYASHGITIREVLTDNGPCYRSAAWAAAMAATHTQHRRTRPFRPQTNGKVERYQRTMRDEWAYGRAYGSESARRAALNHWLHIYNHHRPHTALGGKAPITRVTNVPGQNS
jgi:transposase InsO family protein